MPNQCTSCREPITILVAKCPKCGGEPSVSLTEQFNQMTAMRRELDSQAKRNLAFYGIVLLTIIGSIILARYADASPLLPVGVIVVAIAILRPTTFIG